MAAAVMTMAVAGTESANLKLTFLQTGGAAQRVAFLITLVVVGISTFLLSAKILHLREPFELLHRKRETK